MGINLFFVNLVSAQNIEFKATDIEFFQNQNLTVANNGIVLIKEDKISAEGTEIKYFIFAFLIGSKASI